MNVFSIKIFFQDIWQNLRCNKSKTIICCVVAVVGTVLGVVLYKVSAYSWWAVNRCEYAYKIVYGGFFSILVGYLLYTIIISLLLCCLTLWCWVDVSCYAILLVISIYFGANCCAICSCYGVLGVFYILFVLLLEQLINMICCLETINIGICRQTFRSAIINLKKVLILQVLSIFIKIFMIFAILRVIISLI